jgi:DNA-3-methyladenine glycosylase II
MPLTTLRTAGLSQRKAEYVLDLASHFVTGKLSTSKLLSSTDEELADMLISVRGIGRWTVDMFAIFSLRRPNILPVGDLGVQRGVVRWVLSRHAPQYAWSLVPEKVEQQEKEDEADRVAKENRPATRSRATTPVPASKVSDGTPKVSEPPSTPAHTGVGSLSLPPPRGSSPDVSSVPPAGVPTTPAPKRRSSRRSGASETPNEESALGLPALPTPFTASINRVLAGSIEEGDNDDVLPNLSGQEGDSDGKELPKLPEGLSISILKARLDGKKKIKYVTSAKAFVQPVLMSFPGVRSSHRPRWMR